MKLPALRIPTIGAYLLVLSCTTTAPRSYSADYNQGQLAAQNSIQRDELLFMDPVGMVRATSTEHRAFLRDRFGIGYKLDRKKSADFVDGFNTAMDAEAQRRFGERYAATFVEERNSEFGRVRLKSDEEQVVPPKRSEAPPINQQSGTRGSED